MKIAVTSTGPTLDHYVGSRANHCGYLLMVDPETMKYETVRNPAVALKGPSAGNLFIELMRENGVKAVLVGSCSSEILGALERGGIEVRLGVSGSVRRAVERWRYSERAVMS